MIKVLFVISNLNRQGPINQLLYLCKYFDKSVVQPIIVTTSQKEFENSMHNEFKETGVQIIDLKLGKVRSIFNASKQIQKIINENNVHIIQSFGFRSDIISSRLKRIVKITSIRYTLLVNWKMIWGSFLGSILGKVNLHYMRKFHYVVACSYSIHNHLKLYNLNSVIIINSIDIDKVSYKPDFNKIKEKRKSLELPINTTLSITVSSKLKGKNIEFLIKTFQTEVFFKKYLVIAGFVEPELMQKYQNLKNIIFVGQVSNLKDYLQAADYFISASLHEGMPNAVLEAMAVGTPVLLSDIPSHIEIIETSNIGIGKIFNNNNYTDFVKSFNEIENDNYYELTRNCVDVIKSSFNANVMAQEYENLYTKLVTKTND